VRQSLESRFGFAAILRLLWGARRTVCVGIAIALMAGTLLVYKVSPGIPPTMQARGADVGIASAQVLVDSKSSQAVDLGEDPVLIDLPGLIARGRLLANLIATSPLRDQIARRAGIDPATFVASAPSVGSDEPRPPTASSARNVMNVTFNDALPIVTINAEAPSAAIAARISSAAASELGDYLETLAARDEVARSHQLVIKSLGPPDRAGVHRGPRKLSAVVGFGFVLGLWCIAIIVVSRVRRGWRDAGSGRDAHPEPAAWSAPELTAVPGVPARAPRLDPPPLTALPERPERPERPRPGVSV
jgi:hypothetical protein